MQSVALHSTTLRLLLPLQLGNTALANLDAARANADVAAAAAAVAASTTKGSFFIF